jgi:hypothetical protein
MPCLMIITESSSFGKRHYAKRASPFQDFPILRTLYQKFCAWRAEAFLQRIVDKTGEGDRAF